MERLYRKLEEYSRSDYYPFHMPGHKRNPASVRGEFPLERDITEIEGFDNLHHPEDLLLEAQQNVAKLYGTRESFYSVNGSTAALLAAISAAVPRNGQILVARNCHKAVYHAIYLRNLKPAYIYPQMDSEWWINGGIFPDKVERCLAENPEIQAVLITSPTYDGVVSDVKEIAEITHKYGVPLIVDEAHGAHFGFDPYFPESANMYGADLVINSLHKTLPALTQTALLHVNGERVNRRKVKRYLDMLQTSSPSYILMASIDACIHLLEETQLQKCSIFKEYAAHIDTLREELKKLKYLKIIRTENTDRYDRSKFVISVKHAPMSSHELYERLLRDYHLQMEMLAGTYVLAMTTVGDTQEGLDRLRDALLAIDAEIDTKLKSGSGQEDAGQEQKPMQMTDTDLPLSGRQPSLEKVWTIAKAVKCRDKMQNQNHQKDSEDILYLVNPGKMEKRNFKDSAGCISLEYAYLYPPGSPLIVPGERITQEAVEILCWYQEHDFSIEGLQSEDSIEVWIDG